MVKPGCLAVLAPLVTGLTFRIIGYFRNRPLLGAEALAGFLMFSTSTGILMAIFSTTEEELGIMQRNILRQESTVEKEAKRTKHQ